MLRQEIKERFYSHPNIRNLSVGEQYEALRAFEDILKQEESYESVSELFATNQQHESGYESI